MSQMWRWAVGWMCVVGCTGSDTTDTGPSLDTGWFSDTASPENCPGQVAQVSPFSGDADWYWQDAPTVWTQTDRQEVYQAQLWRGYSVVSTSMVWHESGVKFSLVPDAPLEPETDYELEVTDCKGVQRIPFRTSVFGTPLDGVPQDLAGTTYLIDLAGATWLEPGGFGAILSLYFTTPILLMVSYADETHVDFMGAQGYRDDLGTYHQLVTEPTFDFPLAEWPLLPFFSVVAPSVDISFNDVSVPITEFALTGTFSPDGAQIGGATVQGLGDTRYMGSLVGKAGDPAAICEQAAALGVACTECPDGELYCMFLSAVDVDGAAVEGVTLVPKD